MKNNWVDRYVNVVKANKSLEKRRRISQTLKGRVSPMKGRHLTSEQRLRKSFAMRNSVKFQEAMRRRDEEKVRKLHNIPEDVKFIHARAYEHNFARKILIGGVPSPGFVTQSSLRSHGEWIKNSREENIELVKLSDVILSIKEEIEMICNGDDLHDWTIARRNLIYCLTEIVCANCGLVYELQSPNGNGYVRNSWGG